MTSTPWGGEIFHRETTASTMDDAQNLEDQGAPEGSLAWADVQTAGRGRHPGRTWVGEPGAGLLFTVYWSPDRFKDQVFASSLTVGLGVCLWLESLGLPKDLPVSLKWPNDVYLADRKLAGILVRRRWGTPVPGAVHAGIGINLQPPRSVEPLRTHPGSLADGGIRITPAEALEGLLPRLAAALDLRDPRAACELRLWRRGRSLEMTLPGEPGPRRGLVRGLDPSGGLVWETSEGLETLSSGE